MNLWINTARKDLEEVIGRVNGFILNDEEASGITGCRYVMDAAEALKKRGPDFIIIKKGEHGSLLLTNQGFILLPAFPKRGCRPHRSRGQLCGRPHGIPSGSR